jgi:predicted RNA binding protein YcfA (HicA-like mRNA interferase family)
LGRLKPEPFREVNRRLRAAGFVEISQKGSHVKFARQQGFDCRYGNRAEEA